MKSSERVIVWIKRAEILKTGQVSLKNHISWHEIMKLSWWDNLLYRLIYCITKKFKSEILNSLHHKCLKKINIRKIPYHLKILR